MSKFLRYASLSLALAVPALINVPAHAVTDPIDEITDCLEAVRAAQEIADELMKAAKKTKPALDDVSKALKAYEDGVLAGLPETELNALEKAHLDANEEWKKLDKKELALQKKEKKIKKKMDDVCKKVED